MVEARRTNSTRNGYVNGSAVKRMDAMPDFWEEEQAIREKREREENHRRAQAHRRNRIARRNLERELMMSCGYVAFLSVAVILTCITAALYIKLQSDITIHLNQIAALETEVSNLRLDNDACYTRLATAHKLEDIKKQAINDLGMVYPKEDQIVYYSIDRSDFMTQYSEIPN